MPRTKTLEESDFAQSLKVSPSEIQELVKGEYIARAGPVIFVGELGTGKTPLLTGLCVASYRQKLRVRFVTAATVGQIS